MSDSELIAVVDEYGFKDARGSDFEEIQGLYEESSEVTMIERIYKKVRHLRKKYRFKRPILDQDGSKKELIITAPAPAKLIPGAGYSIEFATSVVSDKYLDHIPLERQTKQMERLGLLVSPKTLYNLCLAVSVHLEPVAEKIRKEILSAGLTVHVDETPWPINNAKEKDGHFWVASNQAGSFYRFEPTRSGKVAEEILEGYRGPVLTDGYAGYNRLKETSGIRLAHCWAHVRRKFFEIRENYPDACDPVLDMIDELFRIEHGPRTLEELLEKRQARAGPLIATLKTKLTELLPEARSQGGLRTAIEYTLKRWDGLTAFISDARIPLSNNDAERAIRQAVMGRKNFHGSRTTNGADVAATLYTIIESCKKAELDPKDYLRMAVHMSAAGQAPSTPLWHAKKTRSVV